MRKPIIQKGDKYNRLTAVKFNNMGKNYQQYWLFRCDCGNEKVMLVNNVKQNRVKSCGCLNKELASEKSKTHGMSHTREYGIWHSMKDRCYNKNQPNYKNYGGRGITICDRWKNNFKNFYSDMGKQPKEMSIDRVDNSKGYYKENCRWATKKQQANNRRTNHFLIYKGQKETIAQWSRKTGINKNTLFARLSHGWSIEKALNN